MSEDSCVWAGRELDRICGVIKKNMDRYGTDFPSACATNGRYRIKKNDDWTNGFWTGMLWMQLLPSPCGLLPVQWQGRNQSAEAAVP